MPFCRTLTKNYIITPESGPCYCFHPLFAREKNEPMPPVLKKIPRFNCNFHEANSTYRTIGCHLRELKGLSTNLNKVDIITFILAWYIALYILFVTSHVKTKTSS